MSKTFSIILIVIGVYLLIIFPSKIKKTSDTAEENVKDKIGKDTGGKITESKTDENGVTEGAGGRLKYSIGYTN